MNNQCEFFELKLLVSGEECDDQPGKWGAGQNQIGRRGHARSRRGEAGTQGDLSHGYTAEAEYPVKVSTGSNA